MAEISIKLSSFNDFTAVNVEGLGVIKIKKESSDQGLRHSEIIRDLFKLKDESKNLDTLIDKLLAEGKDNSDPEIVKLNQKAVQTLSKITALRRENQELRRGRLFDDKNGELVEKLFNNATDDDISSLFELADHNFSSELTAAGVSNE